MQSPMLVPALVGMLISSFAQEGRSADSDAVTKPIHVTAWGSNCCGQSVVPQNLGPVVAIAAGAYHSLALRADGTVVAWGSNNYGQTDVPAGLTKVVGIASGDFHSLALRSDGTLVAWGDTQIWQKNMPTGLTNVVQIAAGLEHSLALRSDGTVLAWGWNGSGQTDVPAGLTGVVAIAAGGWHSLALRWDGTVVAWGKVQDENGRLAPEAVPEGLSEVVAIAAGTIHSLALRSDGTVVTWALDTRDPRLLEVPPGLTDVVAVAAGEAFSLALRRGGKVVGWGATNYDRQTDIPADLSDVVAIAAGADHGLALSPGQVRVLYAIPQDRSFRAGYDIAIRGAMAHLQTWYKNELSGSTFSVFTPEPEICRLTEPADYFAQNPWSTVLASVQSCAPVSPFPPRRGQSPLGAAHFTWVLYVDVVHETVQVDSEGNCNAPGRLGAGLLGLTMLPRQDMDGLIGEPYFDDCGSPYVFPPSRYVGGLGHELGHAFGLSDLPSGCDPREPTCARDSLMGIGYVVYPYTYLSQEDRGILWESPFIFPVATSPPKRPPHFEGTAPSMAVGTDQDACSVEVNFEVPAATGEPVPSVTAIPPSGSRFSLGDTWVTVTASNGIPPDAVQMFKVAVSDLVPPRISGTPASVVVNATTPEGAHVTYTAPSATDNCPGVALTRIGPQSGAVFPIADTTVTFRAIDVAGTTATTSFTVHVRGVGEQLTELAQLVVGVGPGASLREKLAEIERQLAGGNLMGGCGVLSAFVQEVEARAGRPNGIPAAQAVELIAAARRIRAVIGC